MGEAWWGQIFLFLSEYTVYYYSLILQFINCNVINLHSPINSRRRAEKFAAAEATAARWSAFAGGGGGGGINFSAARRRGVARRGSLLPVRTGNRLLSVQKSLGKLTWVLLRPTSTLKSLPVITMHSWWWLYKCSIDDKGVTNCSGLSAEKIYTDFSLLSA